MGCEEWQTIARFVEGDALFVGNPNLSRSNAHDPSRRAGTCTIGLPCEAVLVQDPANTTTASPHFNPPPGNDAVPRDLKHWRGPRLSQWNPRWSFC